MLQGGPTVLPTFEGQRSTCYDDGAISNATINAKIQYGNLMHVKFVLNHKEEEEEATTAKPLQIVTWLLMTAYRNSLSCYPIVPSLTLYDVRFGHNACVTDDDTETDDTLFPRLYLKL